MLDYDREQGKQIQEEILQLTIKVKSDVENNDISKKEIQGRIKFYEKKYRRYRVFLLDPAISPDLIGFQDEIIKLKARLNKS